MFVRILWISVEQTDRRKKKNRIIQSFEDVVVENSVGTENIILFIPKNKVKTCRVNYVIDFRFSREDKR